MVVTSTPTSPRSPMQRARSLLAAATPDDAVSPVSGAGSVFSATREDIDVVTDLPGSPEFNPENHPVEQEPLFDWDRWWVDNEVLPVPNGNPPEGNIVAEQMPQEPRYAEVAEDVYLPQAVENAEVQDEGQQIMEVEGVPIRRNRWGDVTVAVAAVASLWFAGVLKGLTKSAA